MQSALKKAFRSTIFLKAVATILGFLFWSLLSESFNSSRWITIPVRIYNTAANMTVEAPQTVQVEIKGRRTYLKKIDAQPLTVNIDAQHLADGPQNLEIRAEQLSLPRTLAVGQTIPHTLTIIVTRVIPHETTPVQAEV